MTYNHRSLLTYTLVSCVHLFSCNNLSKESYAHREYAVLLWLCAQGSFDISFRLSCRFLFIYIGLFWHSIAVHRLRNGVLGARIYIYIFLWVSCVCLFFLYADLFWHIIAVHRVRNSGLGTWVHLSCRYDKRVAYSRRHARLVWSVSPFFFKSTHLY